ncbi:MAG: DEAD/DEAH box helicase family protein [Planctomycetaceae bacterium]|nr:DEAD/DEAH box helicase family protein [Planctomycetaceae bacterium]
MGPESGWLLPRPSSPSYTTSSTSSRTGSTPSPVCITTIQRLYSMLRGDPDLDPTLEEGSRFDAGAGPITEPVSMVYKSSIPIATFDVIFTDEYHRAIYNLWRQVLEYFDAHLAGLTATPSKQTFGFFNQNLVMEYNNNRMFSECGGITEFTRRNLCPSHPGVEDNSLCPPRLPLVSPSNPRLPSSELLQRPREENPR